jgi:hypothetical protein
MALGNALDKVHDNLDTVLGWLDRVTQFGREMRWHNQCNLPDREIAF